MTTTETTMSLSEAAEAVRSGAVTSSQLVESCLARIDATEGEVHSFSQVLAESARATAAELDGRSPIGPLHGVPVALKDLIFADGVATEANCDALEGFVPDRDATVVHRLRAAGAVLIGKTNTHELAFGVSCPASRNPWDPARMTGGSSGGNASALAARQVFGTIGTDTGGSVRIPSSYCGTTALKTTRGLVPRDGLHMLSWTYDTVGPMARTASDCGLLLDVIAGHSPLDPYSSRRVVEPAADPGGLRLGVPEDSFFADIDVDPEVLAVVSQAVEELGGLVGAVTGVAVPNTAAHAEAGATIVFAESAALLAELHGTRDDRIGEEVRAILDAGAAVPGTALAAALAQRQRVEADYLSAFEDHDLDVIIAPVTPNQVLSHGSTDIDGIPLIPATTQFTFPVNGAGLPAIALPGGFAADGMPIGFQLIGRPFADATLLALGRAFQRATGHHDAAPTLDGTS